MSASVWSVLVKNSARLFRRYLFSTHLIVNRVVLEFSDNRTYPREYVRLHICICYSMCAEVTLLNENLFLSRIRYLEGHDDYVRFFEEVVSLEIKP